MRSIIATPALGFAVRLLCGVRLFYGLLATVVVCSIAAVSVSAVGMAVVGRVVAVAVVAGIIATDCFIDGFFVFGISASDFACMINLLTRPTQERLERGAI